MEKTSKFGRAENGGILLGLLVSVPENSTTTAAAAASGFGATGTKRIIQRESRERQTNNKSQRERERQKSCSIAPVYRIVGGCRFTVSSSFYPYSPSSMFQQSPDAAMKKKRKSKEEEEKKGISKTRRSRGKKMRKRNALIYRCMVLELKKKKTRMQCERYS